MRLIRNLLKRLSLSSAQLRSHLRNQSWTYNSTHLASVGVDRLIWEIDWGAGGVLIRKRDKVMSAL